jgi:hypothetical protein
MEDSNRNKDVYEMNSENQDDMKKTSKLEEKSVTENVGSVIGLVEKARSDDDIEYKPSEKWRILKNIVVISLAFMVHFTAFQGAGNLQSSVNADAGLGTATMATIYFALILSNVFLPVVMIR